MMQYFEVPSVDNSLRKAVLDGIINKLLQESGIKDTEIVYGDDETDTRAHSGSRIGTDRGVSFGVNNKCLVEFSEHRNEDNRHNRGIGLSREVPVFYDRLHEVQLQPVMTQYDIELTVTRNSVSKDNLQRWVNRLNSLLDMGRASNVFEVESFYYIPFAALEVLHAVWETISTIDPQYPTFKDYLQDHLHKSVTVISGIAGGQKRLAGRFNATRIEVVYDVSPPTRNVDQAQHSAVLNVTFSYWRPDELQCAYPITMRQAFMPAKWLPREEPTYLSNDELAELSDVQESFDEIAEFGMVRLPFYEGGDDTYSRVTIPRPDGEAPVWGVDITFPNFIPGQHSRILGWDDLPFEWNDAVRAYLEDCIRRDPSGKRSVIDFTVYIGGRPCAPEDLLWKEDGSLYLLLDIEVDVQYYLVHRARTNWALMPYDDVLILREHPDALDSMIGWVHPEIERPERLPSGKVDWKEFDRVVEEFKPGTKTNHTVLRVLNTTIMTFRKDRDDGGR